MNSGIYKILCLKNKKFYIGSSNDIKRRWQEHKSNLRSNIHHNNHLQRAWNKYGEDNFAFEVLELTDKNKLFDIEQSYLDNLKAYEVGFNQSKLSHGPLTNKLEKDYIITTPSGEELNIKNLSKFCRENGLGNGLYSVARGLVNQDSGYRARFAYQTREEWESTVKRSQKHGSGYKGSYLIEFPDGKQEKVLSLNEFCKKHNLSQGSLRQVCTGQRKHYKNFRASFTL